MQYWRLSRYQARRFWLAMVHTQTTTATALRQQLYLFEDMQTPLRTLDAVAAFFGQVASPARVIAAIEALETEQQLTHTEANGLMHRILARVDATGRWV